MASKIRSAAAIEQQRATEAASDRAAKPAAKEIVAALRALRDSLSLADVTRALAADEEITVVEKAAVGISTDSIRTASGRLLFTGISTGRRAQARVVPKQIEREAAKAAARAGATERGATWASKRSAELVTAVTDSVRASIRLVVADGVARGAHSSTIAKEIRDVVGLDERRATALQNFRARQTELGFPPAEVASRASAYAERLLTERAELIARTETFRSVNEGRADLWRELEEQNVVEPGTVTKTWITSRDERVDEDCEDLDGETVLVDEDFSDGSFAPPDPHPGCRCSLLYEIP